MIVQLSTLAFSIATSVLFPIQNTSADASNLCSRETIPHIDTCYQAEYAMLWVEAPSEKGEGFSLLQASGVKTESEAGLVSSKSGSSQSKPQSEPKSKPKTKLKPHESPLKAEQVQKSHWSKSSGSSFSK